MLEYVEYSLTNMTQRKARTLLTLLGIVIGVAVIVAMVSIGDGMQASIQKQLDKMGGDKISIFPPGGFSPQLGAPREFSPFRERELLEIQRVTGVKSAVPHFWKGVTLEYRNEKKEVMVMADSDDGIELWRKTGFYELEKGRFYRSSETGVAMLGYKAATSLFDREIGIGSEVTINSERFRVIGILKETGDKVGDEGVYVPIVVARNLFNTPNEITAIFVVAENEKIVDSVATRIEDLLEKLRGGKDFEILTTKELAEQISKITTIITFVLGGIASVSIIVGGVIVMNTMLMSVLERTREIGIMKAAGANNQVVLTIFLVESALVGFLGGVAGIALGTVISKVIELVGRAYLGASFMTLITKELVIGALVFSVLIGSVSGIYPAWRASKLEPVEALRYE
jgi:putative ABC transport system permease protein